MSTPDRAPHLPARIEDVVHGWRESVGRRRGLVPTVLPFAGYGGRGWLRVLGRVILRPAGDPRKTAAGIRGWRSFTSTPVRDVAVEVTAGGEVRTITTDRGGVLDVKVDASLDPGWQTITLTIGDRSVEAPVFVVDESLELGIVSDVDDTVMVTALPRPFLAAWNTFVLDEHARTPVAGMAVLYERLLKAHPGIPVIYLSTGAWNVVATLTRFLSRNLYPRGPLLLTDWGPTHTRWFRSGMEHKRGNLRRLAEEFPDVRWLLIGDDGQHDPMIYGEFAAEHPDSVAAVAIRQLTAGEAVLAGGRSEPKHEVGDVPWIVAPDGAGLSKKLGEQGLLPSDRA